MIRLIPILYLHILVVVGLVIASCGSTRNAFEQAEKHAPFDAIIVPGVPFDSAWSDIMRLRILWSHHLFERGLTKNIIYSGSAVYTPYVESRIMAAYAIELGIPADRIFTEEQAEHSTENVFYSYYMAKDLGFDKIALATDPFQDRLVRTFVRNKDLELRHMPIVFDTIHAHYRGIQASIDPSNATVENFIPLPERESYWKRLMGTLGKNLKYHPWEITDARMKYESDLIR